MDVLSVPFEKGGRTQLLSGRDDYNLKGGFIKGSQYAWLGQDHRLWFISTADNSLVDSCSFASMTVADPDVELTTEVTCVKELMPRKGKKTHQLVVGLNHNNQTGMVCIYDMHISRIVRAVHIPSPVTSLSVVDHGLGGRESRQVLHQVLREMDGILAIGLSSGELLLVDLRRCDYERATPYSSFRDEFNVCYLLPVTPSNSRLGNEERLRRQEGDHLCVFINSMYLRETGMLVDKTPQKGCELITHNVSVTCLQYVSLIVALVVGYDEGFFQLWDLRNLKLEFSSYARNRRMGSLSHVVFQEPNDDPHPVCYLWTTHEDATQHAAILYSLVYSKWEYNAVHGYLYKEFVSVLELSACNTALKRDTRARFLDCYCLERVKEGVRAQGQVEADLSLAVFVWEQEREGRVTTHAHLFDMNEWLKEHRCVEEDRMRRSCVSFTVPAGAVAVAVQPETLRHFATLQRLDKHLSPNALSFNWLALMQHSVEKGYFEGVQKKLVTEILSRGPTCLVDADLVVRCFKASLQPTVGCEELPQTDVERKKYLLNLMLEYNYSPDVFVGSGENASDFRLLSLLHAWGWERAQVLKDNIDHLSVRLFDLTGARVDEMWHAELRHCGTQLLTLYMLFSQLEKLAGESLTNIWEHKEGVMLMHVYYIVLQWFVTKGLLPESLDDASAIPYPVAEIKQEYTTRRQELAACGKALFIDEFLERECEEEDLLRLGLVNGVYPPHSLQCLVKMYLLSEIPLSVKNVLSTYVFKDIVFHLDENRRQSAVQDLEDFSSKLQFSDSVVHLAESLWLFDHGSFPEGVAVLVDNGVSPADVMPWLHTNIVNMLVSQHQFSSALAFMKWNKMASKNKDDARLFLMVCLAEKSFDTAFQFVREFCQERTRRDVLHHFLSSCERAGLLRKVMHQPLLKYEEEEFLNYLRCSSSPDSEDMRVLYFTMRGRVAEGLAENDRINRERLHRPRRRRLLCDDTLPLRQLMASIYCKVYPKNWRPEEDQRLSLLLTETGKTDFDTNLQEKSSVSGSVKRPCLSREVRSTLHSVYVSSPGFPHVLASQSATTTPQGILKVRSYASTRDTSVETLATASSMSNLLDSERDTITPAKRIQFRISSDSSEKMELDEDVQEQHKNPELLLENEEDIHVATENDKVNDALARHSTTDEEESDHEELVSSNFQEPAMRVVVEQAIKEPSEHGSSADDFSATSKNTTDNESLSSSTTVAETVVERPSSAPAAPWSLTDITRFNRRGIGPRRPLPSASREAAANIFVSVVNKKTRTTESSLLVVEEVDSSSAPGKRRLDFDAVDSHTQSSSFSFDRRSGASNLRSEKILSFEVEDRVQCDQTDKEDGDTSRLNTSEGSCVDVLSIDISDEIFSEDSSKVGVLELDNTSNSIDQSDVSDIQVKACDQLKKKCAESGQKGYENYTTGKFISNSDPVSVQGSNLDQTSITNISSALSVETFQNKLKKVGLVLGNKNLQSEHQTAVHDSESEQNAALVIRGECNISVSAEVSSMGENELSENVSIDHTAFHTETNPDLSKVQVEEESAVQEQDVSVQAPGGVNIPSKNYGFGNSTEVPEPVRLIHESPEVAQESNLAVEVRVSNEASEDVEFFFTDVTELNPDDSFSECNFLHSLPSSTSLSEEKAQVLERISTSEDVEVNLNRKNPSEVSVSKLLNSDGRIAESTGIKISSVKQTEPSKNIKIPFGLSLELLSKENTSRLLHEGTEPVSKSSDAESKGHQTKCVSWSEISHDGIRSTAQEASFGGKCVTQLILHKETSKSKPELDLSLSNVPQDPLCVERQSNDVGTTAVNMPCTEKNNKLIPDDSLSVKCVQILPVSVEKEHSNHNSNTGVFSGTRNNENNRIVNIVDSDSSLKIVDDSAVSVVQSDVERAVCSTDDTESKKSESPVGTDVTQMEAVNKDEVQEETEPVELSVIQTEDSKTANNSNSTNSINFQKEILMQEGSQKGHTLVHSVKKAEQTKVLESSTDNFVNKNKMIDAHSATSILSEHHTTDMLGCTTQEIAVEVPGTADASQLVDSKNKMNTLDLGTMMSADNLSTPGNYVDAVASASNGLPINDTLDDAVPSVLDAEPSVLDSVSSVSDGKPSVSDAVPSVSDAMPSVSDAMPPVSDAMPSVSDAMQSVSDAMQSVSDAVPSVSDAVPSVSDAVPSVSDAVPSVSDAVPSVSDAVPSVSDAVPSVSDSVPSVSDSVSSVSDTRPSVSDAMPSVSDAVLSKSDAKPSISDAVLSVSDAVPLVSDAMPSVSDSMQSVSDAVLSVSDNFLTNDTSVGPVSSVLDVVSVTGNPLIAPTICTSVDAVPSVLVEGCATSSVPKEIVAIEFRDPEKEGTVTPEIQTNGVFCSMEDDTVADSEVTGMSTLAPKELIDNDNNESEIINKTSSEVVKHNIRSGDSQHESCSKSHEDCGALSISSKVTSDNMSEIPVVADTSHVVTCSLPAESSETIVIKIDDSLSSKVVQKLPIEDFSTDSSRSVDKAKTATADSLELRSRSIERSLDDGDVPESISVKRKLQSLELHTGMLKKRRSMSVLSLNMEVQETSSPPRRQRRASLSCSEELRNATPPLRRSLRLSAIAASSEDDLSTVGSPSRRSATHRKRKGQLSKKQLQTVYEDMELTTDAARKKHGEDPYPDTSLSSPFMMPRRFTRSQLRMMKQNVRLEEMRSLGVKSPSSSQMSAEDASDEEDGRSPSVCGSEVSSMVSVSDLSEGGRRSQRIRQRSYSLRSRTSNSPVSEVSHTQSTSSHDDLSSVVSGMSEVRRGELDLDASPKDGTKGKRQSRKTRKNRQPLPFPEDLSSPTDSQQSQLTEDERKSKTRELRRSQRRSKSSESHDQTSTTSLSDVDRSPVVKDDERSSSSSDHQILPSHALARQKKEKRRQARQVSSTANPTKKTKISEEKDAPSARQSHPRPRYSRSAVYGRKSVRVRSSTSSTAKDKVT